MGLGAIDCTLGNKSCDTLFTLATILVTAILYIVETWEFRQSTLKYVIQLVILSLP